MKNPKLYMVDLLKSGRDIKAAYRIAFDKKGASDKECLRETSRLCKNDKWFSRAIERIAFNESKR